MSKDGWAMALMAFIVVVTLLAVAHVYGIGVL